MNPLKNIPIIFNINQSDCNKYIYIIDDYSLQIDFANHFVSIINLKKGGKKPMTKTVLKALEGFERQFDELQEMKANLENEKEIARNEALLEVERKFALKSEQIERVIATVSIAEEIEVPDVEVEADNEMINNEEEIKVEGEI